MIGCIPGVVVMVTVDEKSKKQTADLWEIYVKKQQKNRVWRGASYLVVAALGFLLLLIGLWIVVVL